MRSRKLFAAGISVALLLGAAATPALAKPGNGKAKGHVNKPAKPEKAKPEKAKREKAKREKAKPAPKPKKSKAGINGGGATAEGAEFSIQARTARLGKGHFNYTTVDESFKLRCRGFDAYSPDPADPTVVTVTSDSCQVTTGPEDARQRQAVTVTATFDDNGQPAETEPPTAGPDRVTFTATDAGGNVVRTVDSLVTGNVKVR